MKLPYSYRSQFFNPVLALSILGHVAVFTAGAGLFNLSPEFGVQRASSSMEVVISKVEVKPKLEVKEGRVLTARESEKTVPVKEIKEGEKPQEKFHKPVYIPPAKGALERKASPHQKNPAPVYPEMARERGWEGLVLLRVKVEAAGNPAEVQIEKSSGYKILDDAAVRAVRQWRFKPASIGNASFASWVRIPVRFSLVENS